MAAMTVEQALALAEQHRVAGRAADAEKICRQVLASDANQPGALHLLGLLALQSGKNDDAATLIGRAVDVDPSQPHYHNNLGLALMGLGQNEQAERALREAIRLKPGSASAHHNLGLALLGQKRFDDAIVAFRAALRIQPGYAKACNNLGGALKELGRLDEAIAAYRDAIRADPHFVEAHCNLGIALREARGDLTEAERSLGTAVQINPNFAEAFDGLCAVLHDAERFQEALAAGGKAVLLAPRLAQAHSNLGNVLLALDRLDEAVDELRRAIELDPALQSAWCNLGNARKDQADLDGAIEAYRRAISLKPEDPIAWDNLLYALEFHPQTTQRALREEQSRWRNRQAGVVEQFTTHPNDPDPDRKLRIGYVSPEFREHCQSFFTIPLLSNHNHGAFEITCYSSVRKPDFLTERLKGLVDRWRDVAKLSDGKLASLIRDDAIDILVDLTMHMSGNRLGLFARKPAPVQVSWLAYPGSTGLAAIDYRITDPHLHPPGSDDSPYAERPIQLSHSFWCYDPLSAEPEVNALPAIQRGYVTFGCLNNFCKVNDDVLNLWSKVLSALPGSRLLILAGEGSHRQRVLQRLGVDSSRIEFVARRPRQEYLKLYHRIDLALDTFPYNGHTTSLDAMWMGVPTITLIGDSPVGRAGLCQLANIGMTGLVAKSAEDYMRIALELASNSSRLAELRASLRHRMQQSPLMDAPQFARNMEKIYREIWRLWCANLSADE